MTNLGDPHNDFIKKAIYETCDERKNFTGYLRWSMSIIDPTEDYFSFVLDMDDQNALFPRERFFITYHRSHEETMAFLDVFYGI